MRNQTLVGLCRWTDHISCTGITPLLNTRGTIRRKTRSAVSQTSAREVVARALSTDPESVQLISSCDEQPLVFVDGVRRGSVSWSYSGSSLAVAVSAGPVTGVDLVKSQRSVGLDVFFNLHGSTEELGWIARAPDSFNAHSRLWAAKEALGKALGCGLGCGWDALRIHPLSNRVFAPGQPDAAKDLFIYSDRFKDVELSVALEIANGGLEICDWRNSERCICISLDRKIRKV